MVNTAVTFKLDTRANDQGVVAPSIIREENGQEEYWCNTQELDSLFQACANRWGTNWDLNKLIVSVKESEID